MKLNTSYKHMLLLALPLLIGNFIQSALLITDAAFVARVGVNEFNASGNAGLIYVTFLMFGFGLSDGVQILVSRAFGAGNKTLYKSYYWSGVLSQFLLGAAMYLFIYLFGVNIIENIVVHKELEVLMIDFLKIRALGLIFAMLIRSTEAFFTSTDNNKIIFFSSSALFIINVGLDYLFIFGNSFISPMGLVGAAYASVSAEIVVFLILFISLYVKRKDVFENVKIKLSEFKELWRLSLPLMFQGMLALATWSVFFFWIEHMGIEELAISQTLRSMYFILFIPVFGFIGVTKTYVSNIYETGTKEEVVTVIKKIITLCFLILIPVVGISYLLTEPFVLAINDTPALVEKTTEVYRIVGGALVLYGVAGILFASVSGLGKTRTSLVIELICISIYFIVAYPLTHTEGVAIKYVWLVEYVYFLSLAIASSFVIYRILKSNKKWGLE